MRHGQKPWKRRACMLCGSVAVAEVAGNYLCAEHAIDAMERDAGPQVEETTTARM